MKVQVSDATSKQLDFLVLASDCWSTATLFLVTGKKPPAYSTDWEQGGPIIEREGISTWVFDDVTWRAQGRIGSGVDQVFEGPTLLVAAMRCYVASKLGDEVDIPQEVLM